MGMSEVIAEYIRELLRDSDSADIQRNEVAQQMGCVPSQINYVLQSRFKPEYGYVVESRRGGGGYIRITRIPTSGKGGLMHIINSIGDSIDGNSARVILGHLFETGALSENAAQLMNSALSDNVFPDTETAQRDKLRAAILKNMLITYYTF